MQKIQIIGFFFENRLHWQSEVGGGGGIFLQTAVLGFVFIYVQMKHKYIFYYIHLRIGEKIFIHKMM